MEVLEEAGTPYYYSTLGKSQEVKMVHGNHLKGGMELEEMTDFCLRHDIRLLIDTSHPFAEVLHHNVATLASELDIPLIRYDRIYPPHSNDIIWCADYNEAMAQLDEHGVSRLLALTGVNTISRLRRYWEKHECWMRILNRPSSIETAKRQGFPTDHLVYYEEESTTQQISRIHPDGILTKESGLSGGFMEKVECARACNVKVFAVRRPPYPGTTSPKAKIGYVDGPHGLRLMVEKLLPTFYPLHSGLTTGTCATAAAVAECIRQTTGEQPDEVAVVLPDGETIHVEVGYGEGYSSVTKHSGDDPDVTNGIEVRASVAIGRKKESAMGQQIEIRGGEGVGTFTLPGFDYPPGSAAINKTPRMMISDNLRRITHKDSLTVTISVPQGEEIARRTFNPRLGIEGGISIIGVSGIVKPFSEEAFILSIRKCMEVAKASGTERVVINSGAKSEKFVKGRYPDLPRQAFVEYGNYIGETLKMACELEMPYITLGIMLGKAVKLAAGHLDTHSRKATFDRGFISNMLEEAHCTVDIGEITLARELWKKIPTERTSDFAKVVISHCEAVCRPLVGNSQLTILLIDDEGQIYE